MISGRYSVTVVAREGGVYVMTLIVKEATVADSGTYTCLAANRLGQAKANLKLDLSQGEPRSSPGSFSLSRGKFSEGNGCFCFSFLFFSLERFGHQFGMCRGVVPLCPSFIARSILMVQFVRFLKNLPLFTYECFLNLYC